MSRGAPDEYRFERTRDMCAFIAGEYAMRFAMQLGPSHELTRVARMIERDIRALAPHQDGFRRRIERG